MDQLDGEAERFRNVATVAAGRGDLEVAIAAYRRGLIVKPTDGDLGFGFGLCLFQSGALSAAQLVLGFVRRIAPNRFDVHAVEGMNLAQLNILSGARDALTRAIILRPDVGDVWFNLAQVQTKLGKSRRAALCYRRVLAAQPNNGTVAMELGVVEYSLGNHLEAEASLTHALDIAPDLVDARLHLGLVLSEKGDDARAIDRFREVLVVDTRRSDAAANLANLLRDADRAAEAIRVLDWGFVWDSRYPRFWSTRSALAFDRGQANVSRETARKSMILDPTLADGPGNLAQSLFLVGDTDGALRFGRIARTISPNRAVVTFNLAIYQLGAGDLTNGWRNYRVRSKAQSWPDPVGLPGDPLSINDMPGRNVLITAEQGLGDEILLASCLRDTSDYLLARGVESIHLECDPRLIPLYERSFPTISLVPRHVTYNTLKKIPDYEEIVTRRRIDTHLATGDLPEFVRANTGAFQEGGAYLVSDEAAARSWHSRFEGDEGPLVGVCWRSRRTRTSAMHYYPSRESLGPVLTLPNVRFISLQYDEPEEDLAWFRDRFGVDILQADGLDTMNDIDGIAGLIAILDGIVSANTAVFHLAGALGKPTYMLDYGYGWYTHGTGRFPWYPSVRYHTRMPAADWKDVVRAAAMDVMAQFDLAYGDEFHDTGR